MESVHDRSEQYDEIPGGWPDHPVPDQMSFDDDILAQLCERELAIAIRQEICRAIG